MDIEDQEIFLTIPKAYYKGVHDIILKGSDNTKEYVRNYLKETIEEELTADELEKKLVVAEANYKEKKQNLETRLLVMYEAGDITYLDVLLNSKSISDFISRYYLISQIAEYDEKLMEEAEIEKISITDKFTEIQNMNNFTKIDDVPQIFIDAIISVEDRRFYSHKGVDVLSIGRAIITDIRTRDFTEGGSTITQQIAKNEYFTQNKNFYRKVAEIFVARDIEKEYSKIYNLELISKLM